MKKAELSILIGFLFSVVLSFFTVFASDCSEVRQNVLRLHILANSDSEEDQNLKLAVRDAVLAQTEELFSTSLNKLEAEKKVKEYSGKIEQIAREEILRQGYAYDVTVRLVNMYFDTRQYDDYMMPAGRYDAVRITIGKGEGHNWWCVMFPPMCIPAAQNKAQKEIIGKMKLFSSKQPALQYVPKFAVVELFEKLRERLFGQK